jgi:hypothetical protein
MALRSQPQSSLGKAPSAASPGANADPTRRESAQFTSSNGIVPLTLLTPKHAMRLLRLKTGVTCSQASFYRWISEGRILTVRMGYRLFVPVSAVEECVQRCLAGERF